MSEFEERISGTGGRGLIARDVEVIQVNVGLKCNQACLHCHLDCSPGRTEVMDWPVMERVVEVAEQVRPGLVDITGGAPELNPHLKGFIEILRKSGRSVQVRTNFTAMLEPGFEDFPGFYREHRVALTGSMPCYLEENVRAQRGGGVYEKSVKAIEQLNELGYGVDPHLQLNLVYNPGGPFLPGSQAELEAAYKKELDERFGIRFTNLLTITNMPVGRFWDALREQDKEREYMQLLKDAFNEQTTDGLMCRYQVSVAWDGTIYDCDFNLALGLKVDHGAPDHIQKFDRAALARRRIVTGMHCFGCTAGQGSSCAGAMVCSH